MQQANREGNTYIKRSRKEEEKEHKAGGQKRTLTEGC